MRAGDRLSEARYVRLDGKIVFESLAQLTAGPTNAINVTELGEPSPNYSTIGVWSGTLTNGTPSPDYRCRDWSSEAHEDAGLLGNAGNIAAGSGNWTNDATVRCTGRNRLYCFEK